MKLKIGLEIHAQLEGKKMFCHCPTVLRDDEPDFMVSRRLHAAAGETGQVDVAAMHEMKKQQTFVYEGYHGTNCLVELDEEPPHDLNQQVLETALQVAKLLKMKIVDSVQMMRKTVVDGSNTSGFQRTALVAHTGVIATSFGDVGVESLCIEEDAAKIISRKGDVVRYRLDRLGIPLLEIATAPDITSGEQAKEVATYLGMVLRSTGRAKRGIGTIRQDVNVSIPPCERVEIKGAQDLKFLPKLIDIEMCRQVGLQGLKGGTVIFAPVDVSALLKASPSSVVQSAFSRKGVVLGLCLPGFKGLLGLELQPGKRFGTELSDRAKVRSGVGGLFHSDELPAYGITSKEVKAIRTLLECGPKDGFVLISDQKMKAQRALEAVVERANMVGVVKEVRKANPDSTTTFLRPMPGAARMYPETDIGSVSTAIEVSIPQLLSDVAVNLEEHHSLSPDLASKLTRLHKHGLFEEIASSTSVKPAYIAETIVGGVKQIKKLYGKDVTVPDSDFIAVFSALNSGRIGKDSVLLALCEGLDSVGEMMSDEELRSVLRDLVKRLRGKPFGAIMGEAMKSIGGKADGKKISEMLKGLV